MPDVMRKIIHIDMDAFYASVEIRDNPDLKDLPVVVGGSPEGRGVVAAASYEARRFGIHSAMPCARAKRLCPQIVFIRPRFQVYRDVSQQIMEILAEFSDCIEPLALDEAYLDVTGSHLYQGSATLIAQSIRQRILQVVHLTASAGVSYNKFLAKLASGQNKPDGLTVLTPEEGLAFIHALPIGDFYGIGKATETKMHKLGIFTGSDLALQSQADLVSHFGKIGYWYYDLARGQDSRPVLSHRERKSFGNENTYAADLTDINEMMLELEQLAGDLLHKMQQRNCYAFTVTVKVKYADFRQATRSRTFSTPIYQLVDLLPHLKLLLLNANASEQAVRLLGVSFSHLHQQTAALEADLFIK